MAANHRAVIIDPPADLIAERQRLGLDHHDEVWEGDYHVVPAPSNEHQRIGLRLGAALLTLCDDAGLQLLCEANLIPPDEPGWRDFRVPDLVAFAPALDGGRGVIGGAALVIEIQSPGDESLDKLPFFQRLGVGEVVIIDCDTKVVRHWSRNDGALVESSGAAGRHQLACLPVDLWTDGTTLVAETPEGTTRI